MTEPSVKQYGWASAVAPTSCGYLSSVVVVVELLESCGRLRILDLGAGNGALCETLRRAGHDVVGVEYSADGVEQARAAYPDTVSSLLNLVGTG